MRRPLLALVIVLAAGLLAGCDLFGPEPTATPVVPIVTATISATSGPTNTTTSIPTNTTIPSPTITPTVTPTEGAVRPPVGGAAGSEFASIVGAMDLESSYLYTMTVQVGPPEARYTLNGSGEFSAPDSYHTSYDSLGFKTELIQIGDNTYSRVKDGIWQRGTVPSYLYPLGAPPPTENLLALLSNALDASLVGDELVDGVAARHFRFILRPEALPELEGPYEGLAGGELWIDAATRRYLRLSIIADQKADNELNQAVISFAFRNYGIPVTISRPQTSP